MKMKKKYITPTIYFELLEDDVMINEASTMTENKLAEPSTEIKNDIVINETPLDNPPSDKWDDWDNDY